MDFLTFRSNALAARTFIKGKHEIKFNKTELEAHIKSEYLRHYPAKRITGVV